MPKSKLTHRRSVALNYEEARQVDSAARVKQLTVSAYIREVLKAALEPDGTEPRK